MHWLIDPWTIPTLQQTPIQQGIMGLEAVIVFGLILIVDNLIMRRL